MADQIHNLNDSTTTTPSAGDPAAAESPPPPKGPGEVRTEDFKRSSRGNAVKDSLRSKVVFTPVMAAAIAVLKRIFTTQFQPQTEYEQMLISDMAIAKAKLDRAGELLLLDGERVVERAVDFWDVDQTASALAISRSLSRNPERTVHTLGNTKRGAELLISYWTGLATALGTNGGWDEAQRRLAYDLLGVREELRSGSNLVPAATDAAGLSALAARQIAHLRQRIEKNLQAEDERRQALVVSGLELGEDADTKKLRRKESLARGDYNRALGLLRQSRAEAQAAVKGPATSPAAEDHAVERHSEQWRAQLRQIAEQAGVVFEEDDEEAAFAPEAEAMVDTPKANAPAGAAAYGPTAPPRPISGRARRDREKRERERAKAARRAQRRAEAGV